MMLLMLCVMLPLITGLSSRVYPLDSPLMLKLLKLTNEKVKLQKETSK